jgi:hypothetical protein
MFQRGREGGDPPGDLSEGSSSGVRCLRTKLEIVSAGDYGLLSMIASKYVSGTGCG